MNPLTVLGNDSISDLGRQLLDACIRCVLYALQMVNNHPFWAVLTLGVLIWYSSVTVYVAIRGSWDIKHMLRKLSDQRGNSQESASDAP